MNLRGTGTKPLWNCPFLRHKLHFNSNNTVSILRILNFSSENSINKSTDEYNEEIKSIIRIDNIENFLMANIINKK